MSIFLVVLPTSASGAQSPRIVNGRETAAYPSVGALLFYDDPNQTVLDTLCSGTLVGCRTFLTAAHCVCAGDAEDAAACQQQGLEDLRTLRVFFPSAGFFDVDGVTYHPSFSFAVGGDLAVVHLASPVTRVTPSSVNTSARPAAGSSGTIVGFGSTGGGRFAPGDYGVERQGKISTAPCGGFVPDQANLCWQFTGSESTICDGDSGGPLFIDTGAGPVIAGVTSGRQRSSCQPPDEAFDTDVFVHRGWVLAQPGVGEQACGDLPVAGADGATVLSQAAVLADASPELRLAFTVPSGARLLRVALNGQLESTVGLVDNDFDLYLAALRPPTSTDYDCADENGSPFGFCEVVNPRPGVWNALASRYQGDGTAQLTVTIFPEPPADANCDGRVTVADLLAIVRAIGTQDMGTCGGRDINGDGAIGDADLVAAAAALF